jgi:hypothetical protein
MIGGAYFALLSIVRADAFARYRVDPSPAAAGITMSNARVRAVEGDRLVATAHVGEILIERDRSMVDMIRITEGNLFTSDGDEIGFESANLTYRYGSELFEAHGGTRIYNEDADLETESFTYSNLDRKLTVPDEISGTLYDGEVTAEDLEHYPDQELYYIGPLTWLGYVQDAPVESNNRRKWTLSSEGVTTFEGDLAIYPNATATDGQIMLKAEEVRQNRRTNVIVATGNVRYFGQEANLRASEVTVYQDDERAVLTGEVQMLVKAEENEGLKPVELPPLRPVVPSDIAETRPTAPDEEIFDEIAEQLRSTENLRDYPATLLADRVEYWYGEGQERAIITGDPQARQVFPNLEWRMVWAHRAEWNGETEMLRLFSREGEKDARMKNSIGDDFRAIWFEVSTEEEDDRLAAEDLEGVAYSYEEDPLPGEEDDSDPTVPSLQGPIGGSP